MKEVSSVEEEQTVSINVPQALDVAALGEDTAPAQGLIELREMLGGNGAVQVIGSGDGDAAWSVFGEAGKGSAEGEEEEEISLLFHNPWATQEDWLKQASPATLAFFV